MNHVQKAIRQGQHHMKVTPQKRFMREFKRDQKKREAMLRFLGVSFETLRRAISNIITASAKAVESFRALGMAIEHGRKWCEQIAQEMAGQKQETAEGRFTACRALGWNHESGATQAQTPAGIPVMEGESSARRGIERGAVVQSEQAERPV